MRLSRRALAAAGVLAALWVVAVFILLPALVGDAYAGQSAFAWLNRAIRGQSQHPVAYYQSLARRAALLATGGALVFIGACLIAWRSRAQIAASWKRFVFASPTIGSRDVIVTGAWVGFAGGLVEVVALFLRFAGDPPEAQLLPVLWMGPLSAACLGAIVGSLLVLVLRGWRGVSIGVPVMVVSSLAVFAIVTGLSLGIHRYAVVVLSIGVAIQLQRFARKRGTALASMCRRSLPWMGGATLATALVMGAVSRFTGRARGAPAPDVPNVLLLILDTVRAQDLRLYGYERPTSPEIEKLASTGVTFDFAIAPAPWTLPSHASMFTGLPPDQLSTDFHAPLDGSAPTIAEVLRARGYATGGFVANEVYTTRASGLDRGFSVYRDHRVSPGLFLSSSFWVEKIAGKMLPALGVHGALVRKSAAQVNREFLSWMPSDGTPFFAFVNYFDAHTPYKLEPPYDRAFRDPPPRYWRFHGWGRGYAEAEVDEFRDSYNSAIAYVDAQVGSLLRELEQRGVLRNTLVILASDHGEHLGEHGGIMAHGNSLYLPLLHVPLVMSFPSRIPAGTRVGSVVSTQDIPATILDVVGTSSERALPGRSLAAHWSGAGEAATADSADAVFSELTFNDFAHRSDPIRNGRMQSLVRGRLHYIRNGDGTEELYDYVADTGERLNLAGGTDSASVLAPFRQLLESRTSAEGIRRRSVREAALARTP